jgi:hypothetical protein
VTEGQHALGKVSIVLDGFTGTGQSLAGHHRRAYVRALSVAVARSRSEPSIAFPEARG